MRTWGIIISIIVAVGIGATISAVVGVLIFLAILVYQVIIEYSRSKAGSAGRTVKGGTHWGYCPKRRVFDSTHRSIGKRCVDRSGGNSRGVWGQSLYVVKGSAEGPYMVDLPLDETGHRRGGENGSTAFKIAQCIIGVV